MSTNRTTFTATIRTITSKNTTRTPDTVCLVDLKGVDPDFRDYAWVDPEWGGPEVYALRALKVGTRIQFSSIPYKYENGTKDGLGYLRDIKVL
jgi:hypothetical protein